MTNKHNLYFYSSEFILQKVCFLGIAETKSNVFWVAHRFEIAYPCEPHLTWSTLRQPKLKLERLKAHSDNHSKAISDLPPLTVHLPFTGSSWNIWTINSLLTPRHTKFQFFFSIFAVNFIIEYFRYFPINLFLIIQILLYHYPSNAQHGSKNYLYAFPVSLHARCTHNECILSFNILSFH